MDKKAKSILIKTYWTAKGWREIPRTTADEFEYAKSKGLMFDPVSIELNQLKSELKSLINRIEQEKVANGFLSSFTNKRPDWRSALGSYYNSKLILENKREHFGIEPKKYVNEDINVLNFERIKWGGVRHGRLLYNYVDLKIFESEKIPLPTNEDIIVFGNILNCIEHSTFGDYPTKLTVKLKDVINISKDQREIIWLILQFCGVLKTEGNDKNRKVKPIIDRKLVENIFGNVIK